MVAARRAVAQPPRAVIASRALFSALMLAPYGDVERSLSLARATSSVTVILGVPVAHEWYTWIDSARITQLRERFSGSKLLVYACRMRTAASASTFLVALFLSACGSNLTEEACNADV